MSFDAAVVAAHAAAIPTTHWFGIVGLPFSDDERRELAVLAPRAVRVRSWSDAREVLRDVRVAAAVDDDAAEIVALKSRALLSVSPDKLLEVMSDVLDRGLEIFFRSAHVAAHRAGFADETTVRAAAAAAAEAVYRGALAAAVDGANHRFASTEALFASGRWPVARMDGAIYVF